MPSCKLVSLIAGTIFAIPLGYCVDVSTAGAVSQRALRSWTVEDSVAVRYFATRLRVAPGSGPEPPPGWFSAPAPDDSPVIPSPDGRKFFFMFFHGDLATDRVEYELQVFSVDSVKRALATGARKNPLVPRPLRSVVFQSGWSDGEDSAAIFKPYWETNTAIVFLGVQDRGPHRVYRLNIETGELKALTDARHSVEPFTNPRPRGDSIITVSREFEPWTPLDEYPVAIIKDDDLSQIEEPRRIVWRAYATYRGMPAKLVAERVQKSSLYGPWLSPDGRWAILVYPPKGVPIPQEWFDYEVKPKAGYRFFCVDLQSGASRQILDAPAGTVTEVGRGRSKPFDAFWSNDSRHVLLFNTALPLTEMREERQKMSYMVDLAVDTGRWTIVAPMANSQGDRVHSAQWLKEGEKLLVNRQSNRRNPVTGTIYRYKGDKWVGRSVPQSTQAPMESKAKFLDGFTVNLRQSLNDPPKIIAAHNGREISLTSSDPALDGIGLARFETVGWRDPNGREGKGWLMLPRDFPVNKKPLPLVIQLSDPDLEPGAFRPDGGGIISGFAAQALAAQGFAVLQMEAVFNDRKSFATPQEGPDQVKRIDAAVEMFANKGVIDPTRVGLAGFSRSGYLTYYAITHPGRIKLAAASVFDSFTASYGEYVITAAIGEVDDAGDYAQQYGTGNFWENKEGWLDAPAFNVERIVTPVLFSSTTSIRTAMLETVGALRYTRRPFEYRTFPQGSHVLQRPRERVAAMNGTVDWMNFWLQGKEAVGRHDQYERWRKIKLDWEETVEQARAAKAVGATSTQTSRKEKS